MILDWQSHPTAAARDEYLADALRGVYVGEPRRGPLAGGRAAALAALHAYDPAGYGRGRNFLAGPVSRLSAYLRHGMLSVTEVRDHLRERHRGQPEVTEELLRQLAWRDFFAAVLDHHGPAVHADLEEPKHGVRRVPVLPKDVAAGETGLPCADGWLGELFETGYLHNHARLWLAAYLCHVRGVHWSAGARLFRQHLLDGDVASNSCSWQWVEGTFAAKPYFMNRENVARFSAGRWCDGCRAACPFDHEYEPLHRRLFAGNLAPHPVNGPAGKPVEPPDPPPAMPPGRAAGAGSLVWVHDAALSPADPSLITDPTAAAVFVFDEPALRAEPWAFRRLAFVFDGVCELFGGLPHPVKQVRLGDPGAELAAAADAAGAGTVRLTDDPTPRTRSVAAALGQRYELRVAPRPRLADFRGEPRRFSRYWEAVGRQVLGYTPKRPKG